MKKPAFFVVLPCPGCGHRIPWDRKEHIDVNIHSTQRVRVKDMHLMCPQHTCRNPFCEWSKVNEDATYNPVRRNNNGKKRKSKRK